MESNFPMGEKPDHFIKIYFNFLFYNTKFFTALKRVLVLAVGNIYAYFKLMIKYLQCHYFISFLLNPVRYISNIPFSKFVRSRGWLIIKNILTIKVQTYRSLLFLLPVYK